jgi:TorA maturation chaperone TorD
MKVGNTRKEMANHAKARAQVYGLLITIFRAEPGRAFVNEIKGARFSEVFKDMGVKLGSEFYNKPESVLLEELAVEFTRLFVGPGPHISAHESIFMNVDGGEGGLWGKKTVEVKKFIEAAGFNYQEDFTGLPDHISVELEFMQKLAVSEADKWAAGNINGANWCTEVQLKFIDEHLSKWVPDLCDKISEKTTIPFYSEMASLTKSFLAFDRRQIGEYLLTTA